MRPPLLVTATVEAIRIKPRPLSLYKDVTMRGKVVWTGNASMDIAIEVHQARDTKAISSGNDETNQASEPVMAALFTFVARDPLTERSRKVNPLKPRSQEEFDTFQARQAVATRRKALRAAAKTSDKKCKISRPLSKCMFFLCQRVCLMYLICVLRTNDAFLRERRGTCAL